jgi:predicted acyltransferase (DUF342 family)
MNAKRKGVTLLGVIFVVLVISLLALTTSTLVASDATIAVRNYYSQDAFYLATAGGEYYTYQLEQDTDWSSPPTDKVKSFSGGTFVISTTNETQDQITVNVCGILTAEGRTYTRTIRSNLVRTLGGLSDILGDYAVYGFGSSGSGSTIGNNATIIGDIYINNDLSIGSNAQVSGDAQTSGTISTGANVTITGSREPNMNPPCATPTLETTWYDQQITIAATQAAGNRTWGTTTLSGYYYVKGDVTFSNNADITITGSATVVATGRVTVNNNVRFGDDFSIIASKEIVLANNVDIGKHGLWYSRTLIQVGNNAEVSDINVGEGTVFITPGDISFGNNIEFYGFIFAGGDFIQTGNNFYFEGNILVGGDIGIDNNATLKLNTALADMGLLIGIGTTVTADAGQINISNWGEVF